MISSSAPTLKLRPFWLAIGFGLIALIWWGSLTGERVPGSGLGDKFMHTFSYAVVMAWFASIVWSQSPRLFIALGLLLMSVAIEFIQPSFGREFDWYDAAANLRGIVIGWVIMLTPAKKLLQWIDGVFDRILAKLLG